MRSSERIIAQTLAQWAEETITLNEFVIAMKRHGWTQNMIYTWLEYEATHPYNPQSRKMVNA